MPRVEWEKITHGAIASELGVKSLLPVMSSGSMGIEGGNWQDTHNGARETYKHVSRFWTCIYCMTGNDTETFSCTSCGAPIGYSV